jgi:hypothetical protein
MPREARYDGFVDSHLDRVDALDETGNLETYQTDTGNSKHIDEEETGSDLR